MNPKARTQQLLRTCGYHVADCEKKVPATPAGFHGPLFTQDLFKFIDTMAVHAKGRLLAVQSTSDNGGNHSAHVKKILGLPVAKLLAYHMDIAVWSWKQKGGKGTRWTVRADDLTARLLPKRSLLRKKLENGTWEVA